MTKQPETVFVVLGCNEKLKSKVFDFLRAIGLKSLEWDQAINLTDGSSLYIGEAFDAAFGSTQAVVSV